MKEYIVSLDVMHGGYTSQETVVVVARSIDDILSRRWDSGGIRRVVRQVYQVMRTKLVHDYRSAGIRIE